MIEKRFVAKTGRMCWMGRQEDGKRRPKRGMWSVKLGKDLNCYNKPFFSYSTQNRIILTSNYWCNSRPWGSSSEAQTVLSLATSSSASKATLRHSQASYYVFFFCFFFKFHSFLVSWSCPFTHYPMLITIVKEWTKLRPPPPPANANQADPLRTQEYNGSVLSPSEMLCFIVITFTVSYCHFFV